MGELLHALGLVLLVEGLALALAPSWIEEVARMLATTPVEARRLIGLLGAVAGLALLLVARIGEPLPG